jgi:hypothetical protein
VRVSPSDPGYLQHHQWTERHTVTLLFKDTASISVYTVQRIKRLTDELERTWAELMV